MSNSDPYSTVAHLRLNRCSLADKPGHPLDETWKEKRERICKLVSVPGMLDDTATRVLVAISDTDTDVLSLAQIDLAATMTTPDCYSAPVISRVGAWVGFGEVTAVGIDGKLPQDMTLQQEVVECFRSLEGRSALMC